MNVIVVLSDSLRVDHVGAYGEGKARTPNLDRFARESALFTRCYIASYPTVPNRADIWMGRYTFPYRGWQPLEPEDVILPEILGKHGVTTQLIFDTPPLLYGDFYRGFSGWWYIRGQHADPYITDPTIPTPLPAAPHKLKNIKRTRQYLRNRYDWRFEKDYIAPRTFTKAIEWLERNHTLDKFLLFVDTWDPHEPFDPPTHYLKLYDDPYREVDSIIYPRYGHWEYMSSSELRRVRALYAGEVTMVDAWFGYLLETVERLGLKENTMIIFTSDHGHLFGEHGLEGKPGGMLGRLYEITTRIPLIIWHPEGYGAGEKFDLITQPPDLLPTILDFMEIPIPKTVNGRSLIPAMKGEEEQIREFAVSARFPGRSTEAAVFDGWAGSSRTVAPITITSKEWTLICHPDPERSELYRIDEDPKQENNLIEEEPKIANELRRALIDLLAALGTKSEWIEPFRLEMRGIKEFLDLETKLYAIRDYEDRVFAFPKRGEAEECLSPEIKSKKVQEVRFRDLLEEKPKAFIHIEGQYYWAEELKPI